MAKRLTSIRLGEVTDRQIKDFVRLGYTLTQVLAMAIDRYHHEEIRKEQDVCIHAPIYNQLFQLGTRDDQGAIAVKNKEQMAFMVPVSFEALDRSKDFFVEIAHLLRAPFNRLDFVEIGSNQQPVKNGRKYSKGMLVASPTAAIF